MTQRYVDFHVNITLLRNVIHSHSSRQAGYALSQGYISLVVPRQPSVHPRQPSVPHPLLRPVRLEYRHLLEAHRRLVPLESDSSDDDCVGHHRAASSPRTIVAAPEYASSLYHDDSCISPRHVHLVSKVSGRPLGDVYQTLSFDAANFHTVPSLHLGIATTVDPAMMVQPERSFEASAPSVAQLDCSRCSRVLTCTLILVLALLQ